MVAGASLAVEVVGAVQVLAVPFQLSVSVPVI
jgi:hypothetical protein